MDTYDSVKVNLKFKIEISIYIASIALLEMDRKGELPSLPDHCGKEEISNI